MLKNIDFIILSPPFSLFSYNDFL